MRFVDKHLFLKAIPDFPKVLVTINPTTIEDENRSWWEGLPRNLLLWKLQEDCSDIALARSKLGLITLWDDVGEQDVKLLLQRALPKGYQKGACPVMRAWWKDCLAQ